MSSQLDLDQGGTARQYVNRYLGPTVGWIKSPDTNILQVTAAGTASPLVGTTLITLNIAGSVTVQLWDPTQPDVPAGAMPGPYLGLPLTIVDIGGNCATTPCTILPAAGKTIMGLASIQIANAYGAFVLMPNITNGNWVQQ